MIADDEAMDTLVSRGGSDLHLKTGIVPMTPASPHDFKPLLEAEGRRGTTMADVPAAH